MRVSVRLTFSRELAHHLQRVGRGLVALAPLCVLQACASGPVDGRRVVFVDIDRLTSEFGSQPAVAGAVPGPVLPHRPNDQLPDKPDRTPIVVTTQSLVAPGVVRRSLEETALRRVGSQADVQRARDARLTARTARIARAGVTAGVRATTRETAARLQDDERGIIKRTHAQIREARVRQVLTEARIGALAAGDPAQVEADVIAAKAAVDAAVAGRSRALSGARSAATQRNTDRRSELEADAEHRIDVAASAQARDSRARLELYGATARRGLDAVEGVDATTAAPTTSSRVGVEPAPVPQSGGRAALKTLTAPSRPVTEQTRMALLREDVRARVVQAARRRGLRVVFKRTPGVRDATADLRHWVSDDDTGTSVGARRRKN